MFGDDSDDDGDDSDSDGVEDVRNGDTPVTDLAGGGIDEDEMDSGSEDLQRLVATLQSVVDNGSVCSCVGCRWCVCVSRDCSGYSGEKDPKSPLEAWSGEDRLEPLDESTIEEDEEWQDSGQLGVWVCVCFFCCVLVYVLYCTLAHTRQCPLVCGVCTYCSSHMTQYPLSVVCCTVAHI